MKTIIISLLLFLFYGFNSTAQITVTPCAQLTEIHVVVIGSSTAAGTGPSSPDSAWVNRYRKYLQTINPQNQVTNLAIGGTTTYHIMPSWFIPPMNRPATNPNNNVTQAINLGADAIIINMPSNDAANGFSINEQMNNFMTIVHSADSMGVPVWICTTQPRNFSTAQKLVQTSVRDSILSHFGTFAVDFWTGIASANDEILPSYNSGDGVHLNNAGHAILEHRIINKNIPNLLADTALVTDHVITNIYIDNSSICGDSTTLFNAIIGNLGPSSIQTIDVLFAINDKTLATTSTQTVNLINPLATCSLDTVSIQLNTYNGVDYNLQAFLNNIDTDKSNDTSSIIALYTQGHPSITGRNDTVCLGDSSTLMAFGNSPLDTVLWYDAPIGGNIISFGNYLSLSNLLNSQTYYPEVVRGNLYFDKSLATSTTTTTNWNGIMFDIVATDTLTIDSLRTKLNSIGSQTVVAYTRIGSHSGYEMNANAWNLWGNANVHVSTAGAFKTLNYPNKILYPNDTLGVYLHLQNGGATLSYLSSGNGITYANNELQILGGSGVTHTFGAIYTPRNWCGEVFYHHGFNPLGNCNTSRIPLHAIVTQPTLDLGNDTTIYNNQTVLLNNNTNFNSYQWSTNSSNAQLLVDSSNISIGTNTIWLIATDAHGCTVSDTILVTLTINTKLKLLTNDLEIQLFPNPSQGIIHIKNNQNLDQQLFIFNANGQKIRSYNHKQQPLIDLSDLAKGIYWITVYQNGQPSTQKITLY